MARTLTPEEKRQFAKAVVLSEFCPLPTQADASTLRLMQGTEEPARQELDAPVWLDTYCADPQ